MADSDDSMGIEELSEIYRVEKKSGSLTTVRADLYMAMADLLKRQRREYDDYLKDDPESVFCEGANTRRKKGLLLSREIIEMRMAKICKMALRGAMGESHTLDTMTAEEKEYYKSILGLSKNHKAIIDRNSGNMRYTNAKITGEPVSAPAPAEEIPIPEAEEEEAVPDPVPVAESPMEEMPVDVPVAGEFEMEDAEPEYPEDELDRMPPEAQPEIPAAQEGEDDYTVLRIMQDFPTPIAGPIRNYTLKKEQIVRMPADFAQALINRGLAVKVSVKS